MSTDIQQLRLQLTTKEQSLSESEGRLLSLQQKKKKAYEAHLRSLSTLEMERVVLRCEGEREEEKQRSLERAMKMTRMTRDVWISISLSLSSLLSLLSFLPLSLYLFVTYNIYSRRKQSSGKGWQRQWESWSWQCKHMWERRSRKRRSRRREKR